MDTNYTERLENVVKQMLKPFKDIPFNLVIESLTGHKVLKFDNKQDKELLEVIKEVAVSGGKKINKSGIVSIRANEVGNYIENFVKDAMKEFKLKPDTPAGKSGNKKSSGYPDIIFYYKNNPYYLECKTYNLKNVATTQRSFYFSPSEEFKVTHDTVHFMLSYEMMVTGSSGKANVYKCKHYKVVSLEALSIDIKYEFNSDNKRLYSGNDGAIVLAEGNI